MCRKGQKQIGYSLGKMCVLIQVGKINICPTVLALTERKVSGGREIRERGDKLSSLVNVTIC